MSNKTNKLCRVRGYSTCAGSNPCSGKYDFTKSSMVVRERFLQTYTFHLQKLPASQSRAQSLTYSALYEMVRASAAFSDTARLAVDACGIRLVINGLYTQSSQLNCLHRGLDYRRNYEKTQIRADVSQGKSSKTPLS